MNRRERRKRLQKLKESATQPTAVLPSSTSSLPPPSCIGKLEIFFKSVLGQGSHGTIVYKGRLENRDVAVKRLLREFTEVADKEIDLLIRSDEHSSVVRYFAKEFDGNFVYLALELCDCNLRQLVENNMWATYNIPTTGSPPRPCLQGDAGSQVKRALQQLVDDGSAAAVHCNYPEPPVWGGSSCHLVNSAFIAQAARVLAAGAVFETLTDDAAYAAIVVKELVEGAGKVLVPVGGRHFTTSHSQGEGVSYFDRLWQNGSKTQRWGQGVGWGRGGW